MSTDWLAAPLSLCLAIGLGCSATAAAQTAPSMTVALTGDAIITRPVSDQTNPALLAAVQVIRDFSAPDFSGQ